VRRDVNQIFDQFLSHINEVDIDNKKLSLRVKSDDLKIAQDKLVDANRAFVEKTKKMKERIKKKQDALQKAKQKANENINRIFWDLEQNKHWLDSVEGVEDNLPQSYIKTESKIRETQMARELSPLQSAYAEFFFNKLAEFDVDTPAALSDEKKVEFFNSIKNDWKIEKKELAKAGIKPVSENLYPDRELIGIIWSDMTPNDQAQLSKMIKVKILDNESSRKQVLAALKNTPVHIIKKQFPELYESVDLPLKEKAVIAEHIIRNKTKVSKIITAGLSEYMLKKKSIR